MFKSCPLIINTNLKEEIIGKSEKGKVFFSIYCLLLQKLHFLPYLLDNVFYCAMQLMGFNSVAVILCAFDPALF